MMHLMHCFGSLVIPFHILFPPLPALLSHLLPEKFLKIEASVKKKKKKISKSFLLGNICVKWELMNLFFLKLPVSLPDSLIHIKFTVVDLALFRIAFSPLIFFHFVTFKSSK